MTGKADLHCWVNTTTKKRRESRGLTAEHNIPTFTDTCSVLMCGNHYFESLIRLVRDFHFSFSDDLSHWTTLFSPSKPCAPSGDMVPKGKRHSLRRNMSLAWCRKKSAVIQNDRVSPFVGLPEKRICYFSDQCLSACRFSRARPERRLAEYWMFARVDGLNLLLQVPTSQRRTSCCSKSIRWRVQRNITSASSKTTTGQWTDM